MGWYQEQFQQQVYGQLYASGSSQRLVIRAPRNLAGSQLLNGVEIFEKIINIVFLCWQGKQCRLHSVQTELLDCKQPRLSVSCYRAFSITWPAFLIIYRNKRRRFHKKSSTPRGFSCYTNMAAIPLFWNANVAAAASSENAPSVSERGISCVPS